MAGRAIKVDPKVSKHEIPGTRIQQTLASPDPIEVAVRSYELWLERGCPVGSPEVDWFRAEEELRNRPA
jgi:hypothetical protein